MIQLKSLKAQGIKKLDIPGEEDSFEKLEFPEEGEILVHGLNESGKSTLFESIYFALFGTALVPDRSTSSMSQLLNYERDEAVVELEFKVDNTFYSVERSIKEKSGRMNYNHRLEVDRPGQEPKVFEGKKDVNRQIEEELGLDGDSMLNSCFVQQKNLDRLEDSSKAQRERSISTLLNLDEFTQLEEEYSQRLSQLEDKVGTKKKQLEISLLKNKEIPKKEEDLEETETKLRIRHDQEEISERKEKIEQRIEEELDYIAEIEEELSEKKKLKDVLDTLHQDLKQREDWIEKEEELDSIDEEIERIKDSIEEWDEELEEELNPQYEDWREKFEKKKYVNLLKEWQRLHIAAYHQRELEEKHEELEDGKSGYEDEIEKYKKKIRVEKKKRNRRLAASSIITAASVIGGALTTPVVFTGVIPGIVVAAYALLKSKVGEYEPKKVSAEENLEEAGRMIGKVEAKQESSADLATEDAEEELEKVEEEIQELDGEIPGTEDEAEEILDTLDEGTDTGLNESSLQKMVQESRDKVQEVKQKKIDRKEKIEELNEQAAEYSREEIESSIDKFTVRIEGNLTRAENICEELGKDFTLVEDVEKVNSVKSGLETEIEREKEQIEQKEELEDEKEELQGEVEDLEEEIQEEKDKIDIESVDKSREELEELKNTLNQEKGALTNKLNELLEEIDYEEVDPDDAEKQLEDARTERHKMEYQEKIVDSAKHNVMEQVLPKTESNMARFLPILTNGRYKDVTIDKERFNIRVYDTRAGELKEKRVFSGGTRDQFSLSLRLSFAMATIPQEKGSAPDFLFLDEPIGAFDKERKEALTELLTRGEIAGNFSQIFVISHIENLKQEFDKHIKMSEGRVEEKNLEI